MQDFNTKDKFIFGIDILEEDNKKIRATYNSEDLPLYRNIMDWSTSFGWGYNGAGSRQLALAILIHVGLEKEKAIDISTDFLNEFLLEGDMGSFADLIIETKDIVRWIDKKGFKSSLSILIPPASYMYSYELMIMDTKIVNKVSGMIKIGHGETFSSLKSVFLSEANLNSDAMKNATIYMTMFQKLF